MEVVFKNNYGVTKSVKVGFSWTVFFFGGFVFLFRGMPVHGILLIVLSIITWGVAAFIYAFFANKATAEYYLEHGYVPHKDGAWEYAKTKWGLADL